MHNFERHVAGTCHVAHVLGSRTWHQLTPAVPLPRGAPPDERHVACVRRHATWRFLEKHNVALIEVEASRGSSTTLLPETDLSLSLPYVRLPSSCAPDHGQ
eukprot:TRINITY_DN274_c0_g1_i3.p3 TRINITY_DN274_c0_g1~~TRINITY_DN274_c0_g1_i3.p3  ORF type:complete len:101 (-),score=4.71 TRINITY_DN274_c0_g1_i3:322-624(-)